jgi:4-hydroxybenzoyl-CoA reductase subunit alpha
VVSADTEITPLDAGTYASRLTIHAGNAALNAARDAKKQLLTHIGRQNGLSPEQLQIEDNQVLIEGRPFLSLQEAIGRCSPVFGTGYYREAGWVPLDLQTGTGNWASAYTFGAVAVEVEVDESTGKVKVERITAAHDCGYAINPMALEGQMEGATAQGLGQALTEIVVRDRRGATLNPSFLAYKLPLVTEAVPIDSFMVETMDPEGPFGAKGVAEGMLLPVPPAAVNAVLDATNKAGNITPLQPNRLYSRITECN